MNEQQRRTRAGFLDRYLDAVFGEDGETFRCH